MTSTITLLEAIAVGMILMLAIALYRKLMRGANPPALLQNNVVAFGSALLITVAFVISLAFEALAVMPFIHSAFWSAIFAFAVQIAFWAIARSIIPLSIETVANEQ
jgi:hypothetical protein